MDRGFIVVMTTCGSRNEAKTLAGALLRKRLVACANIIAGVESRFWWKGSLDSAKEVLIILKARKSDFRKIAKEIKRLHSYDTPEIIAVPLVYGNRPYLDWVYSSTTKQFK
jgi:periplasmic divalent cation tolerance protein